MAVDRLLDQACSGPRYLSQPAIARMAVEALHYGPASLQPYTLHAFVGMANHLHLLITPQAALPKLQRSLKGITAQPSIGCGMARSSTGWSRRRSTTRGRASQKNKPARRPAAAQGGRPTPQNAGTPAFGELLPYQISWAITVT